MDKDDFLNLQARIVIFEEIINDLVNNVRACHDKHGWEYCGGKPLQFILHDLKELGINCKRKGDRQ